VPTLTKDSGGNGKPQNPYTFKQGLQDRSTGWVKYGARWYDPTTGRWTQQDTLDAPLDPRNANRYAFAANDPINNSDPLGLASATAGYSACFLLCAEAKIGLDSGGPVFELGIGLGVEAGIGFEAGVSLDLS